jgi:hypothetical protein
MGQPALSDEMIRLSSESRRLIGGLRDKAAKREPVSANALQDYLAQKVAEGER